jgi:hypothetical protein
VVGPRDGRVCAGLVHRLWTEDALEVVGRGDLQLRGQLLVCPARSIALRSMWEVRVGAISDVRPERMLTTPPGTSDVARTSPRDRAGRGRVSPVTTTAVLPVAITGPGPRPGFRDAVEVLAAVVRRGAGPAAEGLAGGDHRVPFATLRDEHGGLPASCPPSGRQGAPGAQEGYQGDNRAHLFSRNSRDDPGRGEKRVQAGSRGWLRPRSPTGESGRTSSSPRHRTGRRSDVNRATCPGQSAGATPVRRDAGVLGGGAPGVGREAAVEVERRSPLGAGRGRRLGIWSERSRTSRR